MSLAFLFWVIVLIALALGIYSTRASGFKAVVTEASLLALFVLIVILGWQVFGPAVHR